nr:putative ribonuclease H-like domain-containing protein [Tanacetum cinerariifolium]
MTTIIFVGLGELMDYVGGVKIAFKNADSSSRVKLIPLKIKYANKVLWLQNQLLDYGYNFKHTKIHVDNESAIRVVKSHVYHSKTKHIKIRHHLIRDSYEKRLIEMVKIHTDYNLANLLTKAFDVTSDDESRHEEVIHEISFKTYSYPLFDLDEEIISSEFNPIHNEDLDSTQKNDRFDTKSYLLESLINHDESIPPGIDCDNSDSEGDTLSLERLLHDDPIPLPNTLDFDFSNVV